MKGLHITQVLDNGEISNGVGYILMDSRFNPDKHSARCFFNIPMEESGFISRVSSTITRVVEGDNTIIKFLYDDFFDTDIIVFNLSYRTVAKERVGAVIIVLEQRECLSDLINSEHFTEKLKGLWEVIISHQ